MMHLILPPTHATKRYLAMMFDRVNGGKKVEILHLLDINYRVIFFLLLFHTPYTLLKDNLEQSSDAPPGVELLPAKWMYSVH